MEDKLYAQTDDVERLIRSANFTQNSNPSISDVEDLIDKRTRWVERRLPTAFRELKKETQIDLEPHEMQKRNRRKRKRTRRRNHGYVDSVFTTERWVKVKLEHYEIREIQKLELISSVGEPVDVTDQEGDAYRINESTGVLRIDYRNFKPTRSGRFGSDRLRDIHINIEYTYGFEYIPTEITSAVQKMVTRDIIMSDSFGETRTDEDGFVSVDKWVDELEKEAKEELDQYRRGRGKDTR